MVNETVKHSTIGDQNGSNVNDLLPSVYAELRRLAEHRLASEKPGQTLQATALVHEVYLRLIGEVNEQQWEGRTHFYAAAAEAMRRILVENARRKKRLKRGGDLARVELADVPDKVLDVREDLLALDEALTKLAESDRQAAELIQLRYFGGLTFADVAKAMGISTRTAERKWTYARAWLHCENDQDSGQSPP